LKTRSRQGQATLPRRVRQEEDPTNPTAIAATTGADTPSPSTMRPMSAVRITSVFFSVIPTAKLRRANSATTQAVASICAMPPTVM
jgi:hypothetical protein